MEPIEDSWNFAEGDRITSALVAVRRLGGGAAYDAYLAFDEVTWGPVVVKVLRPAQVANPASLRGLQREVAALEAVNHPVVVRKLRHSFEEDRPHLVLESIDGPRLSTLLRRYGPLQPAQYLPLAIDIASALQYLRHIEHVHLDIKPSNVIMGAPARLIDLSLARTEAEAAALDHPIGTDSYMAPEQAAPAPARPRLTDVRERRLRALGHAVRGGGGLPAVRRGRPGRSPARGPVAAAGAGSLRPAGDGACRCRQARARRSGERTGEPSHPDRARRGSRAGLRPAPEGTAGRLQGSMTVRDLSR